MSEHIRRTTGIILIIVCLMLCLVPALKAENGRHIRFRSGSRQDRGIPELCTERNGSIQVNHADAEELRELPGIGETLASLIITERREKGPYFYAEDLEDVKGIGSGTLKKFRNMIDLVQGESGE